MNYLNTTILHKNYSGNLDFNIALGNSKTTFCAWTNSFQH